MRHDLSNLTCFICLMVAVVLYPLGVRASNPPMCPHILDWNTANIEWALGAPWIKVINAGHIAQAHALGAKVFYRPWDADSTYHDDYVLPASRTGSQYADMVWQKIEGLANKPEAVGYRNEFNWIDVSASKRTCAQFVYYANRLRQLGYTGKIVFGSFGVGWVDSYIWNDSDVRNAVNAADAVETHEYFDLTVACCEPWICFRHRDLAIGAWTYLQGKEWFIGEFGSDNVCNACNRCADPLCRSGWLDNNKLTAGQYITQMELYRQQCANEVTAVFVFAQGAPGWAKFETTGTPVADYMRTTWGFFEGTVTGTVTDSLGAPLENAQVMAVHNTFYSTMTNHLGLYTIHGVTEGTYTVSAHKQGYEYQIQPGKTVVTNQTTTVNFSLRSVTPIADAKQAANEAEVLVEGVVTGGFPLTGEQDRVYTQALDRSAGIGIITEEQFSRGDLVQVLGFPLTLYGERLLVGGTLALLGSDLIMPEPLGMCNRYLGGGEWGYQEAMLDDDSTGARTFDMNNVGLLVRSWGEVTHVDPVGLCFYMDDGSNLNDGSGHTGVRVDCTDLPLPTAGQYVKVTGISGVTLVNNVPVRMLRPRAENDLSYTGQVAVLENPGFETGNLAGWMVYGTIDGVQTGSWFGDIVPHTGNCYIGSASNGGTKSGGVYQRIAATSGQSFKASAWSRIYRMDNPVDSVQTKVGIDPTGGTNPNGASVVWSSVDTQPTPGVSVWRQLTTPTVICAGGYVTIFLDMKQLYNVGWNISCFDDAEMHWVQ